MEIEINNLRLKLNEADLTSSVIYSPNAIGDVFIPQYVEYKGKKYNIILIKNHAFKKSEITSLSFPENSELITFGKFCFSRSTIKKLQIPSKLKHLETGWCQCVKGLVEIEVSPKNKNFSFINNEFLVGKSDANIDTFDILYFARIDIENAKIPSQIKELKDFSFYGHDNLQKEIAPFEKVNELVDIKISPENRHFSYVNDQFLIKKEENKSILIFGRRDAEKAVIPSYITEIYSESFGRSNLEEIIFEENSKLEKIGSCAFSMIPSSSSIAIPKSVYKICGQAFYCNENLKTVEILSETIIIEFCCFDGCKNLSIISFPNATNIKLDSSVLERNSNKTKIFVRKDAILKVV